MYGTKDKKTHIWILTLTIQYTYKIYIKNLFGGLTKDVNDMVKCNGGRYLLLRFRNGCEPIKDYKTNISNTTHSSLWSNTKTIVKRLLYYYSQKSTRRTSKHIEKTPVQTSS